MQALQAKSQNSKFCAKFQSILRDKAYLYNQPYLKEFISADGLKKYKLTIMNCVKNKLVESPKTTRSKNNINTEKLDNNLQRSRSTVYELAYCNKWDYFFTGTLDKTKACREDLIGFNKKFNNFIHNINKKYGCKIKFLIIPELHDDLVSWHFHGFVAGIPESQIKEFKIGDKMGKKIAEKLSLGIRVFHWLDWDNKFGFNDLEFIKSSEAISAYITKYITKDLQKSVKELKAHTYYCSKGLNKANTLNAKKIDLSSVHKLKPDFSNEYCSLYWLTENQINDLMISSSDNLAQHSNDIKSYVPLIMKM